MIAKYFTTPSLSRKETLLFLGIVAVLAVIIRLLIFWNTTIFAFSDFASYYEAAFKIAEGQSPPGLGSRTSLVNAYIAAWLIQHFGSINYWFYFNILISAASIVLIWNITKKVTHHTGNANLTAVFLTIYPTYAAVASVFYVQTTIIFIAALIINLLLLAYEDRSTLLTSICLVAASVLLVTSVLFKWELLYLYIFLGISSIPYFIFKYKKQAVISLIFSGMSFVLFQLILNSYEPMQKYMKYGPNILLFYGHTPYSGGEGVMLDEYREEYNRGFQEYKRTHAGELDSSGLEQEELRNSYHRMLIKEFILNHPFQWAALQIKKFFRTFGIKPEGVSFRILVSGKVPMKGITAGAVLTLPFLFILVCVILLFDWHIFKKLFSSYVGIFMATLLTYYLIATIFYPHYQIRYRLPLDVFFLTPAAAAFLVSSVTGNGVSSERSEKGKSLKAAIRKHLTWKIVVIFIFICAWVYEAYDIFYLNKERYIKNAEQYERGIIP